MTEKPSKAAVEPSSHFLACVDLFCGAGGLTHGLVAAKVPVLAGVDLDDNCRFPYQTNNAGAAFYERDVASLEAEEIQAWFGAAKVRVLAGCAPCQPFSTYSNRYDTVGSDRWRLLEHFGRLVDQVVPDIVTMENVPSVTRHSVFTDFVATLERRGYDVWYKVLDCADYGLPQHRRRTVLLASLHGPIELRPPSGASRRTVGEVLKNLPALQNGVADPQDPLHVSARLSPLNLERIENSKPGGTWRDWPQHLVAECHRKDTGKKYPSVYGRISWDGPAPTLTTQFFGFGSGRFGHPEQARGLSLREGAILQGFPSDYAFVPQGKAIQFKTLGRLIGNAVPVDLGRAIGESIVEHVQNVLGRSMTSFDGSLS